MDGAEGGKTTLLAAFGQSEFTYRAFFNNAPDGMLVASEDGKVLDVNPSACAFLGYPESALLGSGLDLIADPVDCGWQDFWDAHGEVQRQLGFVHGDGSAFQARVVFTKRLFNDNGNRGLMFQPIARAIASETKDGARASAVLERDGTVQSVSFATASVLGYAPEELVGRNALTFVDPQNTEQARKCLAAAFLQGKETGSSVKLRLKHEDGSWHRFRATIAEATDEYRAGTVVVNLEKVGEQEALGRFESRYRTVVEQIKEGVYLADTRTMRVLEFNAALLKTLGYTAEEVRRLTLYDLTVDDQAGVDESVRRALEGKCGHSSERRYRRKDGSLADIVEHMSIVPYEGADVLCVVADDFTERKRIEESLRRSLGVLLALREAAQILGSTLKAEEIVTRLLAIMRGVSGLTAAVISVEDEFGQPRIWREVGLEGLWRRARYAPPAEEARRAVLDVGEHRLFRLQSPEDPGELVGLCLPLRMKERIAGVLEAYGPESLAGEDAVEILRSLAAQAASALENARLYEELAERERRLADLIGQLFTAQEEERRRVAYEVHDGLAQVAAAAHQHLQGFARFHPPGSEEGRALLSQTLELVQRTVGEARRAIANLRPTALDDFGLGTALRIEADRMRAEGYDVDYESNLDENERLPVAGETALFRIAQEALTNVRKHAETERVLLSLDRTRGRVRLSVRDWGRGLDPKIPTVTDGPGERVGLDSMRERASILGGGFSVQSPAGGGTLVTVELPVSVENSIKTGGSGFIATQEGL